MVKLLQKHLTVIINTILFDNMKRILIIALSLMAMTSYAQSSEILTQSMIDAAGKSLTIKKSYSLAGETIKLPRAFSLVFKGGTVDDGVIVGDESFVRVNGDAPVFGMKVKISGTWNNSDVYDSWFSFNPSESYVANDLIKNVLSFARDAHPTHIYFNADRTYHYALQYDGRADIGNMVSFTKKKDGTKTRHYYEVYEDTYDYLRIFTIPSDTHVTINNKWKMNPTKYGAYFVFWEYGKENVTVDGSGIVQGDNYGHLYTAPYAGTKYYGEYGHIFRCMKCKNFVFKDITLADSFGDCILFTGSYNTSETGDRVADGLLIENVKVYRARRNGIALGVRNAIVRNCYFEGCGTAEVKGTNPQSAIDLECDRLAVYSEIGNQNVLVDNCIFKGNEFDVHSYHNTPEAYGKVASVVRNCKFTSKLVIKGTYGIRFENCDVLRLSKNETDALWNSGSKKIEFVDCKIGSVSDEIRVAAKARKGISLNNCKISSTK